METEQTADPSTIAEALAAALAAAGVKRIFGIPGGGSSLDIIQAAADRGIEFVLTRTESAAVMMAAATAELSQTLGVALTTKGPGSANAANGVAYASLDRAPVMLVTDGFSAKQQTYVTHQVFDQRAMLAPLTKGYSRLEGPAARRDIDRLVRLAMTEPMGPVHVELTGEAARAPAGPVTYAEADFPPPGLDEAASNAAERMLANAARPVVIVGLEARDVEAASAVRALVEALHCPVLTTYKAKGVISDLHDQYVGIFTGGAAEADCIEQADLIVFCGVDPVEFILQPWRYGAPVVDIAALRHPVHYVTPAVGVYGSLAQHIGRLARRNRSTDWSMAEIEQLRRGMRSLLQYRSTPGIGPQQVVELAASESQSLVVMPRIAVDAGAHMFSAMAFWPCAAPCDALISNGLATMAFALPAAIAAALHQPERAVIAFTGDGGLLMCLGELATAVQQQARIVIVVFNDGSLSLIDIKQQQRGLPTRGVRWPRQDFAQTMTGLGGRGYRVESLQDYRDALQAALQGDGPALIDVPVDPSGYPEQLRAMRG